MAAEWGNNVLSPGASAGWFFARGTTPGFLPVLSVRPLSPTFTGNLWWGGGSNYPFWNEVGISTVWSQMGDDGATTLYFLVVTNNSNNTISYAFLEADL